VALFEKFVDSPVNGHPSIFGIDSVHQMETSLSLYMAFPQHGEIFVFLWLGFPNFDCNSFYTTCESTHKQLNFDEFRHKYRHNIGQKLDYFLYRSVYWFAE
jgi:hypothetical protein